MDGLMRPAPVMAAAMILVLAWPGLARAGWFERGNQIAYRLAREGHNNQALPYWDHSAEGLYGRGTALMHLGRMREAEQAFREALALAPHKTGFSDQLEMPVKRRPHFMASVWYNLGNTLYAQDELAAARDAWLKALDFEPGHAKASHNLAIVDHLIGARERDAAQPPPAGLPGLLKRKPGKGGSQAASQPQKHAPLSMHKPQRTSHGSGSTAAGRKKAGGKPGGGGAGGASPQHARRMPSPSPAGAGGHAASASGGRHQGRGAASGQGMSRREALQQLRLVEEGVSVFLRHRLSEKGRGSAEGGKPW
jgi:hypothetical protein